MIEFNRTKIPDVVTFKNKNFVDDRGFFMETYNKQISDFLNCKFVQDNYVKSIKKNIIRGLHFQRVEKQAKLIRVVKGKIFDVAVDLRKSSPTYKQWVGRILSEKNFMNMYIPAGFAHGYCTLTKDTEVIYKCSNYYNKKYDSGIIWNDPEISIEWPVKRPILSKKDKILPTLNNLMKENYE